jgi:hypothetical protein
MTFAEQSFGPQQVGMPIDVDAIRLSHHIWQTTVGWEALPFQKGCQLEGLDRTVGRERSGEFLTPQIGHLLRKQGHQMPSVVNAKSLEW